MNLKAVICDSNTIIDRQISEFFSMYSVANDCDFEMYHYDCYEGLLQSLSDNQRFDILVINADMQGDTGSDCVSGLRSLFKNSNIILLSSNPNILQSGLLPHVYRFLTYPFSYSSFSSYITDIINEIRISGSRLILAECQGEEVVLDLNDILYIKADKYYSVSYPLAVHTSSRVYHCKGALSNIEKRLCSQYFVSPVRGYLVNIRCIRRLDNNNNNIELSNNELIPVSSERRKKLRELLNSYITDSGYKS